MIEMNEPDDPKEPGRFPRSYSYIGREDIVPTADFPPRTMVTTLSDIESWIKDRRGEIDREGCIAATFVIDLDGTFWIADRRSEHVACARCYNVLAAGEIYFAVDEYPVVIARITNQSTGYCPEISSWDAVDAVLSRLGIPHPGGFQPAYEFRRCPKCRNITIIKDDDYSCLLCGESLPRDWNLDGH